MAERPILFSAPMVRALLDGRKTQTRRIVKPAPVSEGYQPLVSANYGRWEYSFGPRDRTAKGDLRWWRCPYGQPGDLLWVREAWRTLAAHDDTPPRDLFVGTPLSFEAGAGRHYEGRLRPGIHMPRWASRITLRISDVRVERLQRISEDDATAEGVETLCSPDGARGVNIKVGGEVIANWISPRRRDVFESLWAHINGQASWDANPWVWAVTFEVAT